MRALLLFLTIFCISLGTIYPQWTTKFTSPPYFNGVITGWLNFKKNTDSWENRMYYLDATSFNILQAPYSTLVQYSYNFTVEEISAGYQIYSLQKDVTGDQVVDFYVLSYYGTAPNYRTAFKIIDITTNTVLFQKNDPQFSYSSPVIWDVDEDKILECVISKTDYPAQNYVYQEVYNTGMGILGNEESFNPGEFGLKQNFPNPFNPSTTIEFEIEQPSVVTLEIYDITGALIKTLNSGYLEKGKYSRVWDGRNESGKRSSSGIYMYRLSSGVSSEVKKMVVLK